MNWQSGLWQRFAEKFLGFWHAYLYLSSHALNKTINNKNNSLDFIHFSTYYIGMAESDLSLSFVLETLEYHPETGALLQKKARPRSKVGSLAGGVTPYGYRYIQLRGRKYAAHRLVWFIEHGRFPPYDIDHIDGNKLNNKITNLREATRKQNCENKGAQKNNKLGLRGVSYNQRLKKYIAQIQHNGVNHYIGLYKDPLEARKAYIAVAKSLFTHYQET